VRRRRRSRCPFELPPVGVDVVVSQMREYALTLVLIGPTIN